MRVSSLLNTVKYCRGHSLQNETKLFFEPSLERGVHFFFRVHSSCFKIGNAAIDLFTNQQAIMHFVEGGIIWKLFKHLLDFLFYCHNSTNHGTSKSFYEESDRSLLLRRHILASPNLLLKP